MPGLLTDPVQLEATRRSLFVAMGQQPGAQNSTASAQVDEGARGRRQGQGAGTQDPAEAGRKGQPAPRAGKGSTQRAPKDSQRGVRADRFPSRDAAAKQGQGKKGMRDAGQARPRARPEEGHRERGSGREGFSAEESGRVSPQQETRQGSSICWVGWWQGVAWPGQALCQLRARVMLPALAPRGMLRIL